MSELPHVEIPGNLRPADGRFGSGPSKIRVEHLLELAVTGSSYLGTSHRRDTVKSVVGSLRSGLATLFSLPDDYEVALGVGGATAFWDAAAFGLIEAKSQHLVFGEFSSKFAAAVDGAPHLEPPHVIESDLGTHPTPKPADDIDVYALTHNETSTGVAMPVVRPAGANGLVVVDATSAAGGMPVDPFEFDVYYFSPQKAFAAEGGLWAALLSPAAVDRIEAIAASDRWIPPFLSLDTALKNSRKDQTYNTPALATVFLFERQVRWMLEWGGLEWAIDRCRASSSILYEWADASAYASPFVQKPEQRSPTVATIDLVDSVNASIVSAVLRENGIVDTESYRRLGRNQLRVAAFPSIEPADTLMLTRAIDFVVERVRS